MEQAKKSVENLKQVVEETNVSEDQQETLDDITKHIDRFQDNPKANRYTLRDRLETAVTEFDADHHKLMESMREAILSLNVAGV